MNLNHSPTELTTSATDAALAIECLIIIACLWRTPRGNRWKTGLWSWAFSLLAFASLLGAIAHGFELADAARAALWKPLYLSLGILVALFIVGALYDWCGRAVAGRAVPWAIGVGIAFFVLTQIGTGAFVVFVLYEAVAFIGALAIYLFLAGTRRLRGAGMVATAIVLNLAAGTVQATHASAAIILPLDHNGLFHLVQMVAVATLGLGLRISLRPEAQPRCGELAGISSQRELAHSAEP